MLSPDYPQLIDWYDPNPMPPGAVVCPVESKTWATDPSPNITMIATPQNSAKGSRSTVRMRDQSSSDLGPWSCSSSIGAWGCRPSADRLDFALVDVRFGDSSEECEEYCVVACVKGVALV